MRFVLFDKIDSFDKGIGCVGTKNVTIGEDYFLDHYSRLPLMPEPLMIESLAQVGGWAITLSNDYKYSPILAKIGIAKFFRPVRPGDQLKVHVEIVASNDYGSSIKGFIKVEDEIVAEVDNLSYAHHAISEETKDETIDAHIFSSGGFLKNRFNDKGGKS